MNDHRGAPLTSAQQEVWLHAQLAGDVPLGNQAIVITRRGPLDVRALERALTALVHRHESWRTTVRLDGRQPMQVVGAPFEIRLTILPSREALALSADDLRRPFDLRHGPLFRARLTTLADDEHRLLVVYHRLIGDHASIHHLLLPELTALYDAFVHGSAPPPPSALEVADVARRQREFAATPAAARQLGDWRRRLAGPPPVVE